MDTNLATWLDLQPALDDLKAALRRLRNRNPDTVGCLAAFHEIATPIRARAVPNDELGHQSAWR